MNDIANDEKDDSEMQIVQISNKRKPKVYRPKMESNKVPSYIEDDVNLKHAMEVLPKNYDFEIPRSIWRIKQAGAKKVALQFPEGLMIFSTVIADIIEEWTEAETIIMGDVTYGACCVDDYTAKEFEADFMIHYGHSCLIPIDKTNSVRCIYIFVEIHFDTVHFLETIQNVFNPSIPLALISIIQFINSLQSVSYKLKSLGYTVLVPQSHPLSPGEVLGCTSVPVPKGYTVIGLGDGRFHLESVMISNPDADTYLYNPYSKILSHEFYNQSLMKTIRRKEIDKAAVAQNWGIILGTLGRQGSIKVLESLRNQLKSSGKDYTIFFMSEIFPDTLAKIEEIEAWVQIACPRLSIDWGASYVKPLLNPYEASVALRNSEWFDVYPMDFYAYESKGNWTPNHKPPCPCGFTRKTGCKGPVCKQNKNT